MLSEGFWDEPEQAQKIVQRVAALRERVNVFKDLARDYEDLDVLVELGEEEQDQDTANEVRDGLASISRRVSELELAVLLGDPTTGETRSCPCMPGRVEPKPRTGWKCCSGCICAGRSGAASK